MSSALLSVTSERVLALLDLFTVERPAWTVDAAARELELSPTTAYRYVANLTRAAMLVRQPDSTYRLGPAIVRLDRRLRLSDPLLTAARGEMLALADAAPEESVVFLAQRYAFGVMCTHQEPRAGAPVSIAYDRGRVVSLFKGSASLVILAHLPRRRLRDLHSQSAAEIAEAGLGDTWQAFRDRLAAIRKARVCVASGQVDPGLRGVSVAIVSPLAGGVASLTVVAPHARFTPAGVEATGDALAAAGSRIERALAGPAEAVPDDPPLACDTR